MRLVAAEQAEHPGCDPADGVGKHRLGGRAERPPEESDVGQRRRQRPVQVVGRRVVDIVGAEARAGERAEAERVVVEEEGGGAEADGEVH